MTHIVFLNGPPGCGKDTVTSQLVPYINFQHLKFAAPIKRMVCGLLNEDTRWLEENKDLPHRMLRASDGVYNANIDTPRQLLISLSEEFLKKKYGNDFFGYAMVNEIRKSANSLIIISDSGFASEALPVLRQFGHPHTLQICIERPGHDFSNDSRSYWGIPGCRKRTVYNDGTLHDLTMRSLYAIIRQFPETELLRDPDWIK